MNVNLLNLFSEVKAKILAGVIVALLTLLATSGTLNYFQHKQQNETLQQYSRIVLMNDSLVSSNNSLRDQLKELPNKQIDTVKSIDMELCRGLLDVKDVLNLKVELPPSYNATPNNNKEVKKNEKAYVDIDAPLPPDLVKLLNEN